MSKYLNLKVGKSKIYVLCPGKNPKTGGFESLHQLTHKLRKIGHDAHIVFIYGERRTEPLYPEYDCAFMDAKDGIDDTKDNVLIVPEIYPHLFRRTDHMQKVCWWLSWDYGKNYVEDALLADLHLYQCYYADGMIKKHGCTNTVYMPDYLHQSLLETPTLPKEDIIVYNPKKGFDYTKQLLDCGLQFYPLEGLTRDGVKELLSRAKIYIDFGHGPGRDRIPREAACSNCLVITSKSGSFNNPKDTPIPESFKFDLTTFQTDHIIRFLKKCLADYDNMSLFFDNYRSIIRQGEREFEDQVNEVFA